MSRTYKDLPYRLARLNAERPGYRRLRWLLSWLPDEQRFEPDVAGYEYSRHNHRTHVPIRRYRDWRWIEDDWTLDYGNETQIRDRLKIAVTEYNNGNLDEDWDDPIVYQRRIRWWC